MNVTILDSGAHRGLRAARPTAHRHFIEITPREVAHAAAAYPVLVTKDSDSGGFLLGVVLGFAEGENLFASAMDAGEVYRPLQLQREGFWIADEKLAADLDHPRFGAEGEPLYDAAGAPTPFLSAVAEALREVRSGPPMTTAFLGRLAELGLLAPLDLSLSFDDGSRHVLEDLYAIDGEALRGIDDAAALELFRRGWLQLAYLMINSLKHVPRLAKRKNERA
jgi:hypothetical protein